MNKFYRLIFSTPIALCVSIFMALGQSSTGHAAYNELKSSFLNPPKNAKPWVYWYWMHSAVSKEGIAADLKAMQEEGIGGAYLMTIEKTSNPPLLEPPAAPLSEQWWSLVRFTIAEAGRLGINLAMTPCDGWALAGGPWISPETSMQKVVWSKTKITGGLFNKALQQPESYKGYYKDIAVFAYPTLIGEDISTLNTPVRMSSSIPNKDLSFLLTGGKQNFVTSDDCWIQFQFDKPFTCRSLVVHSNVVNYQAQRLILQSSTDGKVFKNVVRLEPPRHGWQNRAQDNTHAIKAVTSRYFRIAYKKEGSEPGSEDLDAAKWFPELNISQIILSLEPKIHQFEAKNGSVWRLSSRTNADQVPDNLCVPEAKLINITKYLSQDGILQWNAPKGNWTILRIGHTSTGSQNAHAGTATGLECDKFDPGVVKIQFDNWFGEALRLGGADAAKQVLNTFHVDSWECGSQNWSSVFASEFKKRRGYDLIDYLPVMAGIPIESAEKSERVLSDVRETITEVVKDNFFGTLQKLANEKGCTFSAEAVAPTMTGDGMLHFSNVDIPMGEFWYRSPTHDKPNDMLDAISAGHIYGKNIIQSESFTELRLMWDEHPAMLKNATDRNFALGINRFVLHVNAHDPWNDRKPGMTLDGIGLFFQRNQTWWKPGKAWIDYIQRCQAVLQQGRPVADIAVFTGEEIPRRAILPDRLVSTLPGIFGPERINQEKERLANKNIPMRTVTEGFPSSANMADPENWMDPLRGYAYDSFNKDALLRLASVKNGRIELPGGASYGLLVLPRAQQMSPDSKMMSVEVLAKLSQLAKEGATILFADLPSHTPGLLGSDLRLRQLVKSLSDPKLKIEKGAYEESNFDKLGIQRDVILSQSDGTHAPDIGWTHRSDNGFEIYFITNQRALARNINISLRAVGASVQIWDPLTAEILPATWKQVKDRTEVALSLAENGSAFVIVQNGSPASSKPANAFTTTQKLDKSWKVKFDSNLRGPTDTVIFTNYDDWSKRPESGIKYYSGTASYSQQFQFSKNETSLDTWLQLDSVANLAEVYVNGINCGVAWTAPYRVNIGKALRTGINLLKIEVTNTWSNRLTGDQEMPEKDRITWTNKSPISMKGRSLLPAGVLGDVRILQVKRD